MRSPARTVDLEIGGYVEILRRRWAWVLLTVLAVVTVAGAWTATRPDTYRAQARVLLADSAAQDAIDRTSNIVTIRNRDLANEINIAESDRVVQLVRDRLGLGAEEGLPSGTISAASNSDVIEFTFTAGTPEEAADHANAWAQSYVDVKQAKAQESIELAVVQLESALADLRIERETIRADLDDLEDQLARSTEANRSSLQLQVDREAGAISGELSLVDARIEANIESITRLQLSGELAAIGEAEISQEATAPRNPTNAPLSRIVVLALLLGLFAGCGLALLAHNLDQSVSSPEDLAALGITTLAAIPVAGKEFRRSEIALAGLDHPSSAVADGYQKARTALQFTAIGQDLSSIIVTSPNQGEGKTTTSVNLALAFASVGKRVVLADADLRRPRLHSVFQTNATPGLTDAVVGATDVESVAVRTTRSPETLAVIPAGTQPPNPSSFLSSDEFARMATSLQAASDLLVLDAAPVLAVADTLTMVHQTDGVVVVVSAGSTRRNELERTIQTIEQSGGDVLGAVLIGVEETGRYGAYYGETAAPGASKGNLFADSTSGEAEDRRSRGAELDLRDRESQTNEQLEFFVPRSRLLGP